MLKLASVKPCVLYLYIVGLSIFIIIVQGRSEKHFLGYCDIEGLIVGAHASVAHYLRWTYSSSQPLWVVTTASFLVFCGLKPLSLFSPWRGSRRSSHHATRRVHAFCAFFSNVFVPGWMLLFAHMVRWIIFVVESVNLLYVCLSGLHKLFEVSRNRFSVICPAKNGAQKVLNLHGTSKKFRHSATLSIGSGGVAQMQFWTHDSTHQCAVSAFN